MEKLRQTSSVPIPFDDDRQSSKPLKENFNDTSTRTRQRANLTTIAEPDHRSRILSSIESCKDLIAVIVIVVIFEIDSSDLNSLPALLERLVSIFTFGFLDKLLSFDPTVLFLGSNITIDSGNPFLIFELSFRDCFGDLRHEEE
jgi:hypothetical protein